MAAAPADVERLLSRLRELLPRLGASRYCTESPWEPARVQAVREIYHPRLPADELVDYFRAGPASTLELATDHEPAILDEDADWIERHAGDFTQPIRGGILSTRWIHFAFNDRFCVLSASRPRPSRHAAIVLWDMAPEDPQPMFPTLESWLWFLVQVGEALESGEIEDERGFADGWAWDLLNPTQTLVPAYHDLHAIACALAPHHDGWVHDQPLPRDGGWTLEWLRALGIADLDLG